MRCCVPKCKNSKQKNAEISFFRFPLNAETRKRWLEKIKVEHLSLKDSNRICSDHFNETDFVLGGNIRKLKKIAVPSKYLEDSSKSEGDNTKIDNENLTILLNLDQQANTTLDRLSILNVPPLSNVGQCPFKYVPSVEQDEIFEKNNPDISGELKHLKGCCRICRGQLENGVNLFQDVELLEKIKSITWIEIKNHDNLSDSICHNCLNNINNSYNFRMLIINTDNDLKLKLKTLEEYDCKNKLKLENVTDENIPCLNLEIKIEEEERSMENSINLTSQIENNNTYKCSDCEETFDSKQKLYSHHMTYHRPRPVCNICGKQIRIDNLKKHIQSHTDEPQRCDQCGKICRHSVALRHHKIWMHSERQFPCTLCNRSFKLMTRLRLHLKCHENPDLAKKTCPVCGKKVYYVGKHMRSHTGERPYVCQYCSKGFSSGNALKVHIRQHTNEKPYVCELCGCAYPQSVSLRTHIRNKHGQI